MKSSRSLDGAVRSNSDVSRMDSAEFVAHLDRRIAALTESIEESEVWRTVTSPDTDPELLKLVLREVHLEITLYQSEVIEAAIATIGQMPRSMKPKLVRLMLGHQAEEFDHGEMAMRDYVALGGDEAAARSRRPSPTALAVAGVWWMLARRRRPAAYLGALYLFEGLTPLVTSRVQQQLGSRGLSLGPLDFISFHATEDIRHTGMVHRMITDTLATCPGAAEDMDHGFDCFAHVYPLPGWEAALERARREFEGRG